MPDRGRDVASGECDSVHVYASLCVRVTDPNSRRELWRIAAKPAVGVVLGRTCLSRRDSAEVSTHGGAAGHIRLEHLGHLVGNPIRDHPLALRLAPAGAVIHLAVGQYDLRYRQRLGVHSARRDRGVGAGHLERRDSVATKSHRWHHVELRLANAELIGHVGDVLRACIEGQLSKDGVVGLPRRARHRDRAGVGVAVRVHRPGREARIGLVGKGCRGVVGRVRVHAL